MLRRFIYVEIYLKLSISIDLFHASRMECFFYVRRIETAFKKMAG